MNTQTAEKTITIRDIEAMTETEARMYGGEIIPDIKGHTLYLIDLGGGFGYSCLVFFEGAHIYYANDYELHHSYSKPTKDQLRTMYINSMRNKLFTDAEIADPLKNYSDYKARSEFLHNYYGQRKPHRSMFAIGGTKIRQDEIADPIGFAYYEKQYRDFVDHHMKLHLDLIKAREAKDEDEAYWIGAFYYEMCNHEYGINWDADYDTLSAFGNINYREECTLTQLFDQLGFNDVKRRAYAKARTLYYEKNDI